MIMKRPAATGRPGNWASLNARKKEERVARSSFWQDLEQQVAQVRPVRRLRFKQSLKQKVGAIVVQEYINFQAEIQADSPPTRAARAAASADLSS